MTARCCGSPRTPATRQPPSMEGRSRDRPMHMTAVWGDLAPVPSMEGRSRDRPMDVTHRCGRKRLRPSMEGRSRDRPMRYQLRHPAPTNIPFNGGAVT